jgi:hypothetical protein
MALSEACVKFFRCVPIVEKKRRLKKHAENLGFLGSFFFTLRERSRMMRISVHRKNYSQTLYTGRIK